MRVRAFITHKISERYSDCQDRFSVNPETMIVAVSDGISQSIFPDYWAELLSSHYVLYNNITEDDRVILCEKWKKRVQDYIQKEKAKGKDPWRTESNLNEGISAGATVCGVHFLDAMKWEGKVIGDSCIVEIDKRGEINLLSSQHAKFDTYPDFLDSNPSKKGRGLFHPFAGCIDEDNKLLLVSDPFSDFFYQYKESSSELVDMLLNVKSHDDYVDLVTAWRNKGMHNDDSTLIIIEWDGKDVMTLECMDDINVLIEQDDVNKDEEVSECSVPEISVPVLNTYVLSVIEDVLKMNMESSIDEFISSFEMRSDTMKRLFKKKRCSDQMELKSILQTFLDSYIDHVMNDLKKK